jgi:dTDP-4-amino-4,6-dideoxy-D-galactose acyltransferase
VTTPPIVEPLPWDTAFFGVRIARLRPSRLTAPLLEEALAACRDGAVECLYFLADPSDGTTVRLAEEAGFRLRDVRVTLAHQLAQAPAAADGTPAVSVRPGTPADLPALRAIARVSHLDSRFAHDERLAERAPALFEAWIEGSFEGLAEVVHVIDGANGAGGYVTCRVGAGGTEGDIGLVAVAPPLRGAGAGTALLRAALEWFARRGVGRVSVVTQGRNTAAIRLYERAGFQVRTLEIWYHHWVNP